MTRPHAPSGLRGVVGALLAADVAFAFQQTAIIPALPAVGRGLAAPPTLTAWLLSGYLLVASVATPLLGKLADRHGKRRVLLGALGLFLVGSVGAAVSPNAVVLVGFRAIQGVGGAVFPITFSVMRDTVPRQYVGPGVGGLTGGFGIGTALGFGLGGVVAQALSWRLVFAVGAFAICAGIVLVRAFVPPDPGTRTGRLDLVGAALLGGWLAAPLLALTFGAHVGWASWGVVLLFVGMAGCFAAWIRHERRARDPFVDMRVLAARPVLLTNLATVLMGYALFGVYFLVPHLTEASGARVGYGFGAGPVTSGLFLLPAAVGQLVAGPASGALARRFQAKWPLVAGMVVAGAGSASLAGWHGRPWQVGVAMLVVGTGLGLGVGASGTVVTQAVEERQTGISTAFNSTLRRVGGGIGSQVAAALLATMTVVGTGVASERAYVAAFLASAGVCLAAAWLAGFVPGDRRDPS